MTVFESILARRSVRKYKSRSVTWKTISILLEAAIRAPTAIHQEPWGFVVIQDKKLLQELSDRAKPLFLYSLRQRSAELFERNLDIFNNLEYNIFYDAETLVLICGKNDAPYFTADCWLAAENFMLAACGMSLGTCVIGSAIPLLEMPESKAQLGIPEGFEVVVPIILGYPDDKFKPSHRNSPIVLAKIPMNFNN